jgi:CRP/FNR family cyclic AMP-dependent transcriptional regulator
MTELDWSIPPSLTDDSAEVARTKAALRTVLVRTAPRLGLTTTAVEAVVTYAQVTTWRRGQAILATGDPHDLAGIVVEGAVRLICDGPDGGRMIAQLAGPGRLFGVAPSNDRPRLFGAVAHTPSTVAMISRGVMSAILAGLPPGEALRLLLYSWRLSSVLLHDKCLLLMLPLRERLLYELRMLAREFGRPCRDGVCIDVPLRHDDLAALVVATRAKVSRAMAELRALGYVGVVDARIVLKRPPETDARPSMRPAARGTSTRPRMSRLRPAPGVSVLAAR